MKLTYQTGVAALVQFIVMTILNFLNGIYGSVQECTSGGNDCLGNVVLSLLFFLIVSTWFAFLAVLGYAAQDRRSRRLAQLLLATEALVALIALFDARHHPNILGLITSLADAALAIWVATLAYRLVRANGGRVTSARTRRRHRSDS
ncbi:MAG TPA: hypothetical protein VFH39_04260 [Candidatus Saccharimonadales bacterium]|jgi:hypothetical protein|nr:hypothetical protein [Candidatus Saccharimonadales bacterium]